MCMFAQILGWPLTLLSGLTTADILTESEFEDPSVLPPVPELRPSRVLRLYPDWQSTPHLPILAKSVFHPPLH